MKPVLVLSSLVISVQVIKHIKHLAGESFIYGLSGVVAKLIGVVLVPLYAHVFTPEQFGIMALIDVLFGLVSMFAILGLDNASARWFYDTNDTDHRRVTIGSWFWCQLAASMILATALLFFSSKISYLLTSSDEYANLLRLAALTLPLGTGSKVLGNWLRYQRRAWAAVAFATVSTLSTVALILSFVLVWRQGLAGLYTAKLIAAGLTGVVGVVILRKWISLKTVSWHRVTELLRFGLPMVPAAIALWVMMSADRFILKLFWSTSEIGLYAVATYVASVVVIATGAFTQAWGPFAYSILQEENSSRVYARVLDLYSFFGCAMFTAISLFTPLLLKILTAEAYYGAASCVGFLAFASLLDGARYIASLGCGVAKDLKPTALSIGIGAVVNISLNFLLIPRFGKEGAAVATLLAYGVVVVYLFGASQKRFHIPYRWRVGLVCTLYSWLIVALGKWLAAGTSPLDIAVQSGLLMLFFPLGTALGLIRLRYFRQLVGTSRTS